MKRTVGILGGMGPEATIELMSRVLRAVPATDDADHIPLIVDQNPQVPSRIARLIDGRGDDPGPVLVAMAQRLVGAGALALAMPCNTAHHYADLIRGAVPVPFLDMIAATGRALGPGSVGLMASPAVRKVGVFDRILAGRTVHHPDETAALDLIRAIKRDGATPANRLRFAALCAVAGADHLLIACTEFSLVAEPGAFNGTMIDTLDVLVAEIIRFSIGGVGG